MQRATAELKYAFNVALRGFAITCVVPDMRAYTCARNAVKALCKTAGIPRKIVPLYIRRADASKVYGGDHYQLNME